jgi:hypothetical protein
MKPESIRKFDLFYLSSIGLSIVGFFMGYDALVAQVGSEGAARGVSFGPGVAIGAFAFGLAISLLLWWLTSAKRMSLAKWIIVVFFVLGLFGLPSALANGLNLMKAVNLLNVVAQAIAIWYLFQPDAKAWFSGTEPTDTQTFD